MDVYVVYFVVFGIPAFSALAFLYFLFSWLKIRRQSRDYPGSVEEKKLMHRRSLAIVFGIIFGIIALVWGTLAILLAVALRHM